MFGSIAIQVRNWKGGFSMGILDAVILAVVLIIVGLIAFTAGSNLDE
jgi:hypothetical protein